MRREYNDHAQHLVVGSRCEFFKGTVVNGKYLVSTVGEYRRVPDGEFEEVGCDRLYETMVFRVDDPGNEHSPDCCAGVEDWTELQMRGYKTRAEAEAGHEAAVREWEKQ